MRRTNAILFKICRVRHAGFQLALVPREVGVVTGLANAIAKPACLNVVNGPLAASNVSGMSMGQCAEHWRHVITGVLLKPALPAISIPATVARAFTGMLAVKDERGKDNQINSIDSNFEPCKVRIGWPGKLSLTRRESQGAIVVVRHEKYVGFASDVDP